jgi:hypothetical protein
VALLVVVAAPIGAVPGLMHVVTQVAAVELQLIMQLVRFELCASRIFPAAFAAAAVPANVAPIHSTANNPATHRIAASRSRSRDGIITPRLGWGNALCRIPYC